MLEDEPPSSPNRISEQGSLALQGAERLEVVTLDPRERQMAGSLELIAQEHGRLPAIADHDRLMKGHMARREPYRNPGQHLAIAIQQTPAVSRDDRLEVVREITGSGAFIGMAGELELAALHY